MEKKITTKMGLTYEQRLDLHKLSSLNKTYMYEFNSDKDYSTHYAELKKNRTLKR